MGRGGQCGMRFTPVSWRRAQSLAGPDDPPSLLHKVPGSSVAAWWRWCQDGLAGGWRDMCRALQLFSHRGVTGFNWLVWIFDSVACVSCWLDLTWSLGFSHRAQRNPAEGLSWSGLGLWITIAKLQITSAINILFQCWISLDSTFICQEIWPLHKQTLLFSKDLILSGWKTFWNNLFENHCYDRQ